jgi:hypothetical protein
MSSTFELGLFAESGGKHGYSKHCSLSLMKILTGVWNMHELRLETVRVMEIRTKK